jgi:hypothetical protein
MRVRIALLGALLLSLGSYAIAQEITDRCPITSVSAFLVGHCR